MDRDKARSAGPRGSHLRLSHLESSLRAPSRPGQVQGRGRSESGGRKRRPGWEGYSGEAWPGGGGVGKGPVVFELGYLDSQNLWASFPSVKQSSRQESEKGLGTGMVETHGAQKWQTDSTLRDRSAVGVPSQLPLHQAYSFFFWHRSQHHPARRSALTNDNGLGQACGSGRLPKRHLPLVSEYPYRSRSVLPQGTPLYTTPIPPQDSRPRVRA